MVDQVWKSEAQYIVLGYSTLIQDNAVEVLKAIPFDGLTWDECHYGNNIGGSSPAKRAADCAELIQSLPLKRLIALSATPWENEVGEFGAVASTLRPDIFLTAESFKRARVHDPRLLREFFSSSIVEVELHEVRDLPPITPKPWEDLFGATTITMTGEHQEIYTRVREDEEVVLPAAQKVGRLLLTATHPHQIKRHYVWGETQKSFFTTWQLSSKLHWLKEKVTKKLAEGAKVVVATGIYAEGVTRPAEDEESEIWVGQVLKEWFGESQVIILDGTITQTVDATGTSERDRLIRRWRSDPETRVLLISMRACPNSVNLSVPALPGITKLFITALCYPWVPWKQFLGRFWRDGQGVEVEYVVPVFQETIDEALLRLVSRKWQIQQLFRAQVPLTDEEWQYLDGKIDLRRLAEESRSDTEKVNIIGALVQGRGEKAAANVLSDTYGTSSNGEVFARAFLAVQEYSTSGNIARFMRPIIEKYFEQGLVHAEGILDAGCGPLTLERYLNKPVYGVDLNPHVLRLAKSHSAHQGRNARAGVLSTLPQEWTGKFELTVTSLVLDWTSLAKTPSTPSSSERLGIIAELVRVTHPQGRIWITATHKSMNEEILDTWVRTLQAQGFHIIEELTGLVRATDIDRGDRPFMFWSLCFVPNGKPFTSREADAFRFVFETERTKVKRGGEGERSEPKHKREPHHLFEIIERSGRIQTTDKAALEVATHEVERLAQLADLKGWRFHHPPTIALDWRLLASLHARGTLDEELRRRGLIS
jgi:SAM-dependent methyltransferase